MNADVLDQARMRRAELHGALLALEAALATPAGRPEWARGGRAALAGLREAFDDHRALAEAHCGLFEQVLADAPRLAPTVERLRREHVELARTIGSEPAGLSERPERPRPRSPQETRSRLLSLLRRLARHRQLESDLL